jgi:hypothetical protein
MPTFFCFGMRDSLTVLASFNIAPLAAEALAESGVMSKGTATTTMQLACPIAMQWLSVPLHLLGLDMYTPPSPACSHAPHHPPSPCSLRADDDR